MQVLEGENAVKANRDIMGATNPKQAAPGTIRADFAASIEENVVARLGRPRDGQDRNRVLLQRGRNLPADALTLPRTQPSKLSLLGMPAANLVEFFENLDEKPYRARQIMRWLYQRYVTDYARDDGLERGRCASSSAR